MAIISTWLASQGASIFLGFLANVIVSALQTWQADKAKSDLGRVSAERDQARAANAVKDSELEALRNAPRDIDETIKRLEEGNA